MWDDLKLEIDMCAKCVLEKIRIKPIIGEGSKNADILFVLDSISEEEDNKQKLLADKNKQSKRYPREMKTTRALALLKEDEEVNERHMLIKSFQPWERSPFLTKEGVWSILAWFQTNFLDEKGERRSIGPILSD